MIAFHIFGRPVYRYGLFYGFTFLFGYWFLHRVSQLGAIQQYPRLHALLRDDLDNVVVYVIGAIMVGGRLGHVFLYDRSYYSQHLNEIYQVWQGGMSFIGGVIGVVAVLLRIRKVKKLTAREFRLLGDLILCIVPVGIVLGRIGNMLNKELYGKVIQESSRWFDGLQKSGLLYDYGIEPLGQKRMNTNILQSFGEGLVPLIIGQAVFRMSYVKKKVRPGMISGLFFIVYGIARFFAEFLKDVPPSEYFGLLTISQWIMIGFFLFGIGIFYASKKT